MINFGNFSSAANMKKWTKLIKRSIYIKYLKTEMTAKGLLLQFLKRNKNDRLWQFDQGKNHFCWSKDTYIDLPNFYLNVSEVFYQIVSIFYSRIQNLFHKIFFHTLDICYTLRLSWLGLIAGKRPGNYIVVSLLFHSPCQTILS